MESQEFGLGSKTPVSFPHDEGICEHFTLLPDLNGRISVPQRITAKRCGSVGNPLGEPGPNGTHRLSVTVLPFFHFIRKMCHFKKCLVCQGASPCPVHPSMISTWSSKDCVHRL
jgi:hypothetical protein